MQMNELLIRIGREQNFQIYNHEILQNLKFVLTTEDNEDY